MKTTTKQKQFEDYVFGKLPGYILGTLAIGGAMLFITLHIITIIKEILQ
ncbi:MAG: hypothetical protein LBN27_10730 [Prevotellaceae bacterium]|jgi:hypothetical protein|nr:hypothetical protein [Prevotellaceae bacterium]